jgi:guanidinopropionase
MVHVDSHADTLGSIDGTRLHHGAPFLNAAVDGALDPERTIQIGIRGPSAVLWGFSHACGMRVIGMEEADRMGIDAPIAEARRVIGDGPTYVSVDVDAMDSGFTPGTGTPEVGASTRFRFNASCAVCAGLIWWAGMWWKSRLPLMQVA